jgi:hypothetical protein
MENKVCREIFLNSMGFVISYCFEVFESSNILLKMFIEVYIPSFAFLLAKF